MGHDAPELVTRQHTALRRAAGRRGLPVCGSWRRRTAQGPHAFNCLLGGASIIAHFQISESTIGAVQEFCPYDLNIPAEAIAARAACEHVQILNTVVVQIGSRQRLRGRPVLGHDRPGARCVSQGAHCQQQRNADQTPQTSKGLKNRAMIEHDALLGRTTNCRPGASLRRYVTDA